MYYLEAVAAHVKESYAGNTGKLFIDNTRNSLYFIESTVLFRSKQEPASVSSLKTT